MKKLRQVHLYLGCVFAPMLIFFALSGMWQTLGLSNTGKKFDVPLTTWSAKLSWLSQAHRHQRSPFVFRPSEPPTYAPLAWHDDDRRVLPYTIFLVFMVIGFMTTTTLGVVMAYRFSPQRWVVTGCLIFGVACPLILLYLKG